ncbi:probable disease resistance protein At1g61300 [Aegilops tauschii subsp. strangulata]|uniref:Protein kinase domain-containing protein n=5 Tax=Aegilops tauschii TaxID=37682 RepID=A0A453MA77_AEGTS|nr:probable disease resistance protein At1g61300 isoform X1 [Aegilops tauschii subsp. strangulata]
MGRQASAARNDLEHMLSHENELPKALPLSLLEDITDGFSKNHQIGSGGFAVVYKGTLENGTVAVKKLLESLDIPDNKFNEEIRCLMRVKHNNIVRFLGYCANIQGQMENYNGDFVMADVRQRLLCFEYVPKGSLHEYIKDTSSRLDWIKSYRIIKGICEGLHYLHQNCIVHLDLKPANILLDDNMTPKIADFGLSRCFDEKQSQAITENMAGTLGYMAPEFHRGDKCTITYNSDIYSLGVIIIEMLTGKKWYPGYPDVDNVLETWSNKLRKSQRDTLLKQIRLCIDLGIKCTDGNQANRPNTSHIISRLGESENTCIITVLTSSTVPQVERTLENLEHTTNNLLLRRNNVRYMNDIAEKNVTIEQEAAKELQEAQECLDDNPHVVEVESMPSMSVDDRNLQEALRLIKDDPVGVIGIWGPGGVGKTRLLNKIKNSIDDDKTFNYVVQVTASRGCSVEKIQTDIARHLNLNRDGNVESQSRVIFDFLKKRSFLVLLDDIWGQIDLQAVGIPYPLGYANQIWRKVVLTTRSRRVCGQMEVRKDLNVSCLHEDDSWQVFQDKVGHKTLFYSPRIEALARELVKEMKGLPLALITLGKAMYGKTDTAEWEYAIQHMRRSCCDNDDPLDMERIVFSQIKFSFDSLRNNTLRKCFLTCALWPEDQHIYKVELARCWIGLGLVHESDIHSSYTKAYSLMGDLSAACLLDGCGEMYDSFKMHDVVRDMALWISCGCNEKNGKWFVRAGIGRHENFSIPWSQVEFVSLMCNYVLKLPPVGSNPCHMRMLCLGNNWLHESILIEEIKKFTSLTYLDLRFNNLGEIPEELCSLTNLEHLDLSHNIEINEVPYSFGNLIKLKFLYLGWTSIQRIPEGVISKLQSLQVIDFNTFYLRPIPKDLLSRMLRELGTLPHLKAVGITAMCFSQYKLLRESEDLPIRSLTLRRLETRAFYFSDILSHEFAPRTLYELLIHMCIMEEIIFGHGLAEPNCGFRTLNQLSFSDLSNLREITWTKTSPASLFPRLACLDVHSCGKLNHLSWAMDLPCLEQLVIYDCSSMRQAFMRHHGDNQCSGQDSSKTFPCLRYLKFLRCESLVGIGDPDMTFPSLERLVLHHCPELNRLPFKTDNLPRKLQELQIDVGSWERLELEEGVRSFLQPRLKLEKE